MANIDQHLAPHLQWLQGDRTHRYSAPPTRNQAVHGATGRL